MLHESIGAVDQMSNAFDDRLGRAGLSPTVETRQEIIKSYQAQFQVLTAILYSVSAIIGLA